MVQQNIKKRKQFLAPFFVIVLGIFGLSLVFPHQVFGQVPCTSNDDCCVGQVCMNGFCVGPGCPECFTGDTKITTDVGEKEIQKVKEGDVVKSFDSETGEVKEATVTAIHKREVSGYYVLKTESGREVKVTGEHPFLALRQEKDEVGKVEEVGKVGKEKDGYQLLVTGYKFLGEIWEKVKGLVVK